MEAYNGLMRFLTPDSKTRSPELSGVEKNRRLTSITAVPLLVLLFIEGVTILLGVDQTISVHVFVGMLLIPPIALKLASVGYKFIRYYTGDRAYRAAGPPHPVLRALGPLVVLSTITLFASGVVLIAFGGDTPGAMLAHKLSFIVWVAAMSVHVLGHARHLRDALLAEYARRPALQGTLARTAAVGLSLAIGVGVAAMTLHLTGGLGRHHGFDGRFPGTR
jgi:hypothetical protein